MSFEHAQTVTTTAAPSAVWALWSDPATWPSWDPSVTAVTLDGPFAEAKQSLGGTFVLEARDIEHALEVAKVVPVHDGGVEVRPLFDAPVG